MGATLRRLPASAGLAAMAAIGAQVAGHRAFARLVRHDVAALHARASPGRAGVVTEEMLADLPERSAATCATPGWPASRSPARSELDSPIFSLAVRESPIDKMLSLPVLDPQAMPRPASRAIISSAEPSGHAGQPGG